MMSLTRASHLSDGDLLRLLDADGTPQELAPLRAHAEGCARCMTGLNALDRAARLVRARLDDIPVAATGFLGEPGTQREPGALERHAEGARRPPAEATPYVRRGWLRAAVVLLAVAGSLALVPPLRARIAHWLAGAWGEVAGTAQPAPLRGGARPAPALDARPALWFAPAGRELRVVIAHRQPEGALILARTPGRSASLVISPTDPAIAPMASERGLEISNPPGSRSSYEVRVPAGVSSVLVEIRAEPPRVVAEPELTLGARLTLRR